MQNLNQLLSTLDGYIGGSDWFVYLLLGTGLFFTIYLKFPQLRYFRHALNILRGKYDKKDDEGDTSHFQALATALSGTVGTGNIAGVAYAIHLGGPAAIFWMIVTAFLGMTTKFVEVTLSHKYREKAEDGSMSGGPMYYMKNKLNMKWLAILFSIFTIISAFGTGSLPQSNSIASSINATFNIDPKLTGGFLAILLGLVIIGGIKRIAKVTEKLVPAMAFIYLIGALSVIFYNAENIVPSFISIFADVFTGSAAAGGFLGATISFAFNRGVNRGLFSNEAGQGSAPIAHASAKAHEPVSEGIVAILEPFIDTIIICTITGLTLLSSGVWNEKFENQFQTSDLNFLSVNYSDEKEQDRENLFQMLSGEKEMPLFSGILQVNNGKITNKNISALHARSLAEEIKIQINESPFTGILNVKDGKISDKIEQLSVSGKSLLHSSPLTAKAFTKGFFGESGKFIVSIGLLLFAFSTAISWSYYGSRAMTFLFGSKSIIYFNILYVAGFFIASFADTTIIWTFAGIAIAFMTLPNLIGILLLRKDMKDTVSVYWKDFEKEYGTKKLEETEQNA
ncbi:alanine/glycine:cation symporter family protein [Aureibacter tunicatorum]|uniref:AGCS family alanine or glycine:cation symporter n=1 Tax=Aureibacter tunicatorum TaxID=866807 RepID=A0AAE4BTM5_9BACT|nr:sodium:alanine symporter family protein [Aureibacter tunicatorum]MDR6239802.1 AGCS family alanine or glycine:cation symporter [Aureibacter tunicatorum]BDD04277.1 amino acid transporter [Aureibacter tunicatorum]